MSLLVAVILHVKTKGDVNIVLAGYHLPAEISVCARLAGSLDRFWFLFFFSIFMSAECGV